MIYSPLVLLASSVGLTLGCSDFYMNFTDPSIRLSGRTMDLGSTTNWTITTWAANEEYSSDFGDDKYSAFRWTAVYNTIGITGNWFGDDNYGFPSLFGDGINEKGLSCGLLTLIDTVYEDPDPSKKNIFYGTFCQWALQSFANVVEVYDSLDDIRIWGPVILAEHFVLRDANGDSLVIELLEGKKHAYLDHNDGKSGWGIMTNEPTFDWHVANINHYEWKRSLSRQAVAVPGGWYPEDRFLRLHMVKSGMQAYDLFNTNSFQTAFALTAQALDTVSVPMGEQYGTDTGDASGEGSLPDHTNWGVIRDHHNAALYWRDALNPTFRLIRLSDIDWSKGRLSIIMEKGPYFVDMTASLT
jgi:choloylglycine hydrolase